MVCQIKEDDDSEVVVEAWKKPGKIDLTDVAWMVTNQWSYG